MDKNYNFGPFHVDLATRQLAGEGRPIPLTPKVFQTLEILLRNRDRIVSKKELLNTIWPQSHVEEANLTQNISVLRRALGEANSATKFIATFPRQGYRFIGAVEEETLQPGLPSADDLRARRPTAREELGYGWIAGLALLPLAVFAISHFVGTAHRSANLGLERAITHLPGRAFQPVLSPDGTRVAFVTHQDLSGPLRLGVLDLAKSGAPRIVETGDSDAFSPAWSPDGRRLAYLHAHRKNVTVVQQEPDGKPESLTDIFPESSGVVARQLDWSPDGRFLAVSTKSAADEPFRIELIHISEKRNTVLTTPPELSDGDFQPRFSPDGTKLAFVRQRSIGSMEVLYVALPSGDPVSVTDRRDPCGDVDWTPDSKSVLFTPEPVTTSQMCQAKVPSIPGGKVPCWEMGELATGMLQFSVSRSTGRLVLAAAQPNQNIWRAKLERGQPITGWERLIGSSGEDSYPVYSPDGRRIAFISDRSGDEQLWIRESDGRERQLTFGNLKPGAASWNGAGDVLIFSALRERILYRVRVDGGAPEPIKVGEVGSHTAISPDGALVYFVRRFYMMQAPAAGGAPTMVTDKGGFPLRISGDGKWIYYARHRYSSEIWRLRRSDGFTERVTDRLSHGCWGCWSINGVALVYVSGGESEGARLERLDLATGEVRDIGRLPGHLLPPLVGMLTLSPDDRALVAVLAEPRKGDVHLIDAPPWSVSSPASSHSWK